MSTENGGIIFKALFLLFGVGIFAWGIIGSNGIRTFGGLGLIFIALIISGGSS